MSNDWFSLEFTDNKTAITLSFSDVAVDENGLNDGWVVKTCTIPIARRNVLAEMYCILANGGYAFRLEKESIFRTEPITKTERRRVLDEWATHVVLHGKIHHLTMMFSECPQLNNIGVEKFDIYNNEIVATIDHVIQSVSWICYLFTKDLDYSDLDFERLTSMVKVENKKPYSQLFRVDEGLPLADFI